MIPPILFVDDKPEKDSDEFRYKKLERRLTGFSHVIEFMPDLDLNYSFNEYEEKINYISHPTLNYREIVFIHTSLDNPKYPEPVINQAKLAHTDTVFAKFSGDRSENLRKENLSFLREEHIYNFNENGFEIFIKFYAKTKKQEYYFFKYGKEAFKIKKDEIERVAKRIKSNIRTQDQLNLKKLDGNFESIMRLANVYENAERFSKGVEYISLIENVSEYFVVIDKYVNQIKKNIEIDQDILNSIL